MAPQALASPSAWRLKLLARQLLLHLYQTWEWYRVEKYRLLGPNPCRHPILFKHTFFNGFPPQKRRVKRQDLHGFCNRISLGKAKETEILIKLSRFHVLSYTSFTLSFVCLCNIKFLLESQLVMLSSDGNFEVFFVSSVFNLKCKFQFLLSHDSSEDWIFEEFSFTFCPLFL